MAKGNDTKTDVIDVHDILTPAPEPATALSEMRHFCDMLDKQLGIEGVQFHPESILTTAGKELLRNFLEPLAQAMADAKGVDLEELAGNKPEPAGATADSQDTTNEPATAPIRAVA